MRKLLALVVALTALTSVGIVKAQSPRCDETCLSAIADRYMAAMVAHDPAAAPLARGARFTENGQTLTFGEGLWATASGLEAYQFHFNDAKAGQAGLMGVVREGGHLAIMSLRLKVVGGKITEAESIVTRGDPASLTKPEGMALRPIFDEILPPEQRRSRKEMIAIIDSYLQELLRAKGKPSLFHPDCIRIENGTVTANNPGADRMGKLSCGAQLDTGVSRLLSGVRDVRAPLIDEARGLVHVVMFFDHTGALLHNTVRFADGTTQEINSRADFPYSFMCAEVFKIEDGKIKQIEVVLMTTPLGMVSGWPGGANIKP